MCYSHSPYAGITQIRCEGVDSISADLSAWLSQAPPARYLFVKYPLIDGYFHILTAERSDLITIIGDALACKD